MSLDVMAVCHTSNELARRETRGIIVEATIKVVPIVRVKVGEQVLDVPTADLDRYWRTEMAAE